MSAGRPRILALTKYDRMSASTRQRFLAYGPHLQAAGMDLEISPLLGDDHLKRLVQGRGPSPFSTARGYLRRLRVLLARRDHDLLWVHSELFPYLPGAWERLAAAGGKPVVYDQDDATFHQYDSHRRPVVRRLLGGKLEPLLAQAAAATCGNPYLRDYALHFCPNSIVLPTVVDGDAYRPMPRPPGGPLTVGWIGSASTWPNVRPLLPVLRRLADKGLIRVRAVGAGDAAERDRFPGLELARWAETQEIADVQAMDVGIMPLVDGPFERGKSGYKLIQYMACGLPTVASPVGVNSDIVADGETCLLATTPDSWEAALRRLAGDAGLRARMGAAGRARFEARYSLAANGPRLVALMEELLPKASSAAR